jgi:BlaI family transcriptional regulator, penicillinase repressor
VLTVLRNLEAKGVVAHHEEGRQHRYHALIAQDRVQRRLVTRLVDKLFRGSPVSLMAHLVAREQLSTDDVRALQQLLDQRVAELQSPSVAPGPPQSARSRPQETVRTPRIRKPR